MVDVEVRVSLGCSDRAGFEIRIQKRRNKEKIRTRALDFRKAEF